MEPSTPIHPPIWVDTTDTLLQMVDNLIHFSRIAVDTESNSLFAYQEQVCLIQFSTGQTDYLVDTLALQDLSCLKEFFLTNTIEKIFHAAEYDLICLRRDFSFQIHHLFDTMQAGRILGKKGLGLGSMLEAEFHVSIDKRYQRANWGQRPLPAAMLDYARLDTFYLLSLREVLMNQLREKNLLELALEDFTRLSNVEIPETKELCNSGIWRLIGNHDFTPQQAAVLNQLWLYREQRAQSADLPRFKILSDRILLEIAQNCPTTIASLRELDCLSHGNFKRHGEQLVQAVQKGLTSHPIYRCNSHRPDDAYLNRLDLLRRWRKTAGVTLGVESDIILPRDTMDVIAQENPHSLKELESIMKHLPWRLKQYGSQILSILN